MTDNATRISLSNTRTTWVLRQARSSFRSNLYPLLSLSLLLFTFRAFVEDGAYHLTSFIDRDPSLKSVLSSLDVSGHHHRHGHLHPLYNHDRRRRRPFLHLTRVGTLDDDFFSGEDDPHDRVSSIPRASPNVSSLALSTDSALLLPEIVRSGVQFRLDIPVPTEEENPPGHQEAGPDRDRVVGLQFLVEGLELGRHDAAALFFLVSFLSAAYGWLILVFTAMYSLMLGVVFVAVVNDSLGRFTSVIGVALDGARLGLKRLTGFILMRWAIRDALAQLLGLWYFGEIEDQYSCFKLFVRLKLMPFSFISPWIPGYEKEIAGFLFAWFLMDTFVALIFAVDAWVTIVDSRRTGREIIVEGCNLIRMMINQAIQIKCFEAILCGAAARWVLTKVFGRFCAMVFQSVVEVYFMVAWLVFYFAARCKEAHSGGRRFGRRELEGLADGLR